MRYQALILIVIILISASAFHATTMSREEVVLPAEAAFTVSYIPSTPGTAPNATLQASKKNVTPEPSQLAAALFMAAEGAATIVERPAVAHELSVALSRCEAVEAPVILGKSFSDGTVLFERSVMNRWPIASITKLMTSLIALEKMDEKQIVEITKEIQDKTQGNSSLAVGERYTVRDLVYASMVFSSNDAAYALATTYGFDDFIALMNARAKELGMTQTTFAEPSGLSYLNQSSANDLYLLIHYIYNYRPVILEISRKKTISLKDLSSGKFRKFNNINFFAGQKNFVGGKTGFITESGGNLVTVFQKNGIMTTIIVLGSQDRFGDVQKLYGCL